VLAAEQSSYCEARKSGNYTRQKIFFSWAKKNGSWDLISKQLGEIFSIQVKAESVKIWPKNTIFYGCPEGVCIPFLEVV
jgi:hypothetical protein